MDAGSEGMGGDINFAGWSAWADVGAAAWAREGARPPVREVVAHHPLPGDAAVILWTRRGPERGTVTTVGEGLVRVLWPDGHLTGHPMEHFRVNDGRGGTTPPERPRGRISPAEWVLDLPLAIYERPTRDASHRNLRRRSALRRMRLALARALAPHGLAPTGLAWDRDVLVLRVTRNEPDARLERAWDFVFEGERIGIAAKAPPSLIAEEVARGVAEAQRGPRFHRACAESHAHIVQRLRPGLCFPSVRRLRQQWHGLALRPRKASPCREGLPRDSVPVPPSRRCERWPGGSLGKDVLLSLVAGGILSVGATMLGAYLARKRGT